MTAVLPCPCNPNTSYSQCCAPYHAGQLPDTAQTLMRARYSAYVKHNIAFIQATTLTAQQEQLDLESIRQWSTGSEWLGLEVLDETLAHDQRHATVEFIAHWQDVQGPAQHQEVSLFIKPAEQWFFYDPNVPLRAERNAPCPCASGLKYKKCCAPYF